MSSPETALVVYDAFCCRVWPLIVGVTPRACGICGQVPVGIPGTNRTVTVPRRSPDPVVVAVIPKETHP